jgi:hypothetical protein
VNAIIIHIFQDEVKKNESHIVDLSGHTGGLRGVGTLGDNPIILIESIHE